ncbi:carbohydrate porin, partial [Kozakia baliensis]
RYLTPSKVPNLSTTDSLPYVKQPLQPEYTTEHAFDGAPFGDVRRYLSNKGVDLSLIYWGQVMANVTGGMHKKQDYASQETISTNFDMNKLLGWENTSIILRTDQRAGRSLGTDALGDSMFTPAQIYGGGGNVIQKLVYFYLQKTFLKERLRWIIGRYAVGPDYDFSLLGCTFSNVTICGQPRLTTQLAGYASSPGSAWGSNLKFRPTPDSYIAIGLYNSNSKKGGTAGTNWYQSDGLVTAAEFGWEPQLGEDRLMGHWKAGILYDTSGYNYNDVSLDRKHGELLNYIAFDQMLVRNGKFESTGVILMGGWGHSTESISPLAEQDYVGLIDYGQIKSRPLDGFGIYWWRYRYGKNFPAFYQPQNMSGRTLMATEQSGIELTYRIRVVQGVYFSPDYQYAWRPGGTGKIRNASIIGFDMRVWL